MLVEVKESFISKSNHAFKRKYMFVGMWDGEVVRLQSKTKKSIKWLPVTVDEFYDHFSIVDDRVLAEVYVA